MIASPQPLKPSDAGGRCRRHASPIPRTRAVLARLAMIGAVLLVPRPGEAQQAAVVSIGVSFTVVNPTAANAERDDGPGCVVRFGGSQGIGPSIGFTWFSSNVQTTIGGVHTYLGKVNVKPVMGGAAYSRRIGQFEASAALEAGYAFNNVRATGQAKQAYAQQFNTTGVSIRASNSFAWQTSVSLWFDVGRNYGLFASLGYLGVRPRVTTSTGAGTTRQTVNLGSVVTSVGIAYAVF